MIITLGILSIFQLVFLPGLIVTRLMKLQGIWNNILFSLALSPIINYLFVFAATAFGFYNQRTTLIFFGMELACLIYLTYPILNKNLGQILDYQGIAAFFKEYLNINNGKTGWIGIFINLIRVTVFSLAVYAILNYVSMYAAQKNSIFVAWDAVVSWDRWAVDWYNNRLPLNTWHYPQLIPANWSLTYQFMGDSRIKFFAKDYMGVVEIYVPLTIFILGIIKRQPGYFIGVVFTAWLQLVLGSLGKGYVDTAVAFWALSAIACLLLAQNSDNKNKATYIYFGAILAAGTAITKQAGMWIVLTYPFLLFLSARKGDQYKMPNYIPGILLIYLLLIIPWYGYKEYQIQSGNERSEIQYVTSLASREKSVVQTIESALNLLDARMATSYLSGLSNLLLLCFLMLFSFNKSFFQGLVGLIIIPFTFIWLLFFSYDYRNFNLVVPFIGLAAGMGLQRILDWATPLGFSSGQFSGIERITENNIFHSFTKFFRSIKVVYLIIPVLGIFLLPIKYPDAYLISKSISMQKEIGNDRLNRKLYTYQSEYGFYGKILTDYQYLGFLPGLEQYYQYERSQGIGFIQQINEPQVGYALVNTDTMSLQVAAYINQLIAHKKIKVLMKYDEYILITTCRGPCEE